MPTERKHRDRNRDTDVHTDHAGVDASGELTGVVAALGEDRGPVGELARVDEFNAFIEVGDSLDVQHRPEHLLVATGHLGSHVVEDGRSHKEPVFESLDGDATPVEDRNGALFDGFLNPVVDERKMLGVHQWAHIGLLVIGRAQLPFLGQLGDGRNQLVGN